MKNALIYKAASLVIALYAFGHTWGAMFHTPSFGLQADDVWRAMHATTFACANSQCSWFGFYMGFGLSVSLFLIFASIYAWFLGTQRAEVRAALRPLTLALSLAFVAMAILCVKYFFIQPLTLSIVTALLLAVAALREPRTQNAPIPAGEPSPV